MKAVAVFPDERDVRLVDLAEPRISAPTEVKLRILDVGVCGTDREITSFAYGTPPPGARSLVIGHECLAEVVEVGSGVSRVAVGDLVVPSVRRPCPHEECVACRAERQDFCFTGDFRERGIKELHGFMCEWTIEEERWLNVVDAEMRSVAVLVEPLTVAEKALEQVAAIQDRLPWMCPPREGEPPVHCRTALVLGAGAVGLLGALLFVQRGFQTWVYSREPVGGPKASLAHALGAAYLSAQDTAPAEIAERLGAIDLVYEAVGASPLAFEVMQELGPNAVFVLTGVPGRKAAVPVETDRLMRNLVLKNQVVFGTVNASRSAFESAIADLGEAFRRNPQAVSALITERYPLAAFGEAFAAPGGIRRVIAAADGTA